MTMVLLTLLLYGQESSMASMSQTANLSLTLPDTVTISGLEVGSSLNARKCTINGSLDAMTGTTIPLRGGVAVSFQDATGYSIDSGYATANVEGLTHLDIVMVFHCGNGDGSATLKGPYKFSITWIGIPGAEPFVPPMPVSVVFKGDATSQVPNSVPTPSVTNSPMPNASSTKQPSDLLSEAESQISKLIAENAAQATEIDALNSQIKNLKDQLANIESVQQVASKKSLLSGDFLNCYAQAKQIAISRKGSLSKKCLNL